MGLAIAAMQLMMAFSNSSFARTTFTQASEDMEPTPAEVEQFLKSEGVVDPLTEENNSFGGGWKLFNVGATDFILVRVHRDSKPQYAEIFYNTQYVHSYWVSTGAPSSPTPAVTRTVYERNWNRVSKAYGGTMTGAMMFMGGYGIHMTPFIWKLGTAASHGCVRMEDAGVYQLWKLALGTPNVNITVEILEGEHEGTPPEGRAPVQGGKPQPIEDKSGRPKGGRDGVMM